MSDFRHFGGPKATALPPVRPAKPLSGAPEGGGTGEAPGEVQDGNCTHGPEVPCIVCDTGPCPVCGKRSIWRRMYGRPMHADGTNNGKCWEQLP